VLLLGLGIYHGLATDRWSAPVADDAASNRFASMKNDFGDWIGERMPRGDDDDNKTSVVITRFTNRATGKWLIASITSGRAGRVSIHNPEHCYLGNGYKVADAIREETLTLDDGKTAKFWTGHFQKKKPSGMESIRIYWSWTADGNWQAPAYPRLFFAGTPSLHKLYLIHPVPLDDSTDDSASYKDLMVQYVRALNRQFGP
jgi:hypothetical protein